MSEGVRAAENLRGCRSQSHSQPWISLASQDNKFPNSFPTLSEPANPFFPGDFDLGRVQLSLSVLQLDPADRAVIKIADKRDAIQKKVFTNWVNHHLSKRNCWVQDLFLDLRSGYLLVRLLEILTNEVLVSAAVIYNNTQVYGFVPSNGPTDIVCLVCF
ncbi:putative Microtubule-actin cross-linking factor [Fasciolopsis buskii]|uniref:Putative Microtubule-actin cross-linking factor n=1 Tax=Fasciolopsis buskii TaxID=27845 RepID=A0A8E0RTM5_9TREM|nr:putative Microtubule-actin cross-linking factor [Fasciolopsis buski]